MKNAVKILTLVGLALAASQPTAAQSDRLFLWGDIVYFYPPPSPQNCVMQSRFKPGEPVGFRMTAINPATGRRDRATEMVVHLQYAGKTIDVPMRDRQTEKQPERDFWVAKWTVPMDAPTGVVRYTVTARDSQGRTGEFKPFDVQTSQLTIVN